MTIASDELNCIFYHIPKTAGTSITEAIQSFGRCRKFGSHQTLEYLKTVKPYSYTWDNYFKFTFIREPLDRLYSIFSYYKMGREVSLLSKDVLPETFEEFVLDLGHNLKILGLDYNQMDVITDDIDFIGRFEYLEEDFSFILKSLKTPRKFTIPHKRVSKRHKEYYPQYSYRMKQIAISYFSRDIIYLHRNHGYYRAAFHQKMP